MICFVYEKDLNPCSPTYQQIRKKQVTCPPNIICSGNNDVVEDQKDIIDNTSLIGNEYTIKVNLESNFFYLEIKTSDNVAISEDFVFFIKYKYRDSLNIEKTGNINFILQTGFDYVKTKKIYLDSGSVFLNISESKCYGLESQTILNLKSII